MKQSISYRRLVDISWPRIAYIKSVVSAVFVGFCKKIPMKVQDIIHKPKLKILDVFFTPFVFYKLRPGTKQVFYGNDIVIGMSELNPSRILKSPPPVQFWA